LKNKVSEYGYQFNEFDRVIFTKRFIVLTRRATFFHSAFGERTIFEGQVGEIDAVYCYEKTNGTFYDIEIEEGEIIKYVPEYVLSILKRQSEGNEQRKPDID
jgi:hypothetical protein